MKFIFLFIAIILIISFSLSNKKNDDVFTEDIEDENEDEFCAPTKFNPANGAPMIGCFDIYGNTYGVNGAEDIYNNDYSSYENLYENLYEDTTSSLYLDTSYDSFSDHNFYN